MLVSFWISIYTLLCSVTLSLCSPTSGLREDHALNARDNPERDVYLVYDTEESTRITLDDGRTVFYVHSSIFVAGNSQDGPLKIEIAIRSDVTETREGLYLRVKDLGTDQADKLLSARGGRIINKLGPIKLRNTDLFDPKTKTGLALDVMNEDPHYRVGKGYVGNMNGCNVYAKRLVAKLGLTYPSERAALFSGAEAWQSKQPDFDGRVNHIGYEAPDPENPKQDTLKVFTNGEACSNRMAKRDSACGLTQSGDDVKNPPAAKNDLAANENYKKLPDTSLQIDDSDVSTVKAKGGSIEPPATGTEATLTRAGGVFKSFTAISKTALAGLGVAGTLVGAAFVILDFIDHNWVGGAIGAVGLAAGAAVAFFSSGPVGWIIGGVVAALFAILPGLFKDTKPPPKVTDIQGIIQWKMFGDASHTGNEQCQKGTDDVPGNKDCQALYGSGTLATVLGLNNFDSIAYLIQANDGYPIAIKDMAPTWYVIDPKKENDGADKVATINCNNDMRCQPPDRPTLGGGPSPYKRDCIPRDDPDYCKKPTFQINRKLITLPIIGQTADKVFDRLIPNDHGDCKLVAYPGSSKFDDFDLTIQGLPSAIACGLTAAINVDGTAIPLDAPSGGSSGTQTGSSSNQSTDGQGGAYVAPPPKKAFAPLDADSYPCITYTGQSICLPPGKFDKQSGLGYEQGKTTALTIPKGWSVQTYWDEVEINKPPAGGGRVPSPLKRDLIKYDHTYYDDQDSSSQQFISDMKGIDKNQNGHGLMTVKSPKNDDGPDPVCCLYNSATMGGDVLCLGVGGDDLPSQWKKQAQSAKCLAGAQMWIYADKYGDAGGALINGEVDDLKNEPYGEDDSFSKNVVAVWISKQK